MIMHLIQIINNYIILRIHKFINIVDLVYSIKTAPFIQVYKMYKNAICIITINTHPH